MYYFIFLFSNSNVVLNGIYNTLAIIYEKNNILVTLLLEFFKISGVQLLL